MFNEEEFVAYYKSIILPELDQFEVFRQEKLLLYRQMLSLCVISVIVLFSIILYSYPNFIRDSVDSLKNRGSNSADHYIFLISITIMSFVSIGYSIFKMKKSCNEFKYTTKSGLYNKIIAFYPNLKYQAFKGIDLSSVLSSKLFGGFDRFKSEDYIEGKYKSTEIKLSEIELTKIVTETEFTNKGMATKRREVLVFKGLFLITSFNKKFSFSTYILPNSWIKVFMGLFSGLKRVTLEDPKFEKLFDVYSDSQVESRYLLTPSFMERLAALGRQYQIRCCFINGQMMIAVPLNFDFLPSLKLNEKLDYQKIKGVICQLNIFFEIIDGLKLDMNIGL